jgi:hypothetical protein
MRRILIFTAVLLQIACTKSSNDGPLLLNAKDYFPLDSAKYWLYQATFIHVDAAVNVFDTNRVELKMKYKYYDDSLEVHVLERYLREDSSAAWSPYDIITVTWKDGMMQWVEDNLRYVKLTDPVLEDKSWDGNSYNILTDWNYYYSDLNTSFEVDEHSFSSTIRVEKRDIKNVIREQRAFEVYAKDLGSVYEYGADFTYQGSQISTGQSRELVLLKFGEE